MSAPADLQHLFILLKRELAEYDNRLKVITDNDKRYELIFDSPFQFAGKTYPRLYFSAASVEKNYVTLHFFPIYSHPRQFDDLPERLRKTLKGKSCFNFKKLDEQLIEEIRHMLDQGFELYSKAAGSVNA